jgi:hypothetical protein
MRALPVAAAVLLSLVFTVGGVAIVGRADSPAAGASPAVKSAQADPAWSDPSPTMPKQCGAPRYNRPYHGPIELLPNTAAKNDTIPLNTRGYNYVLPGEVQFDPTGVARAQHDARTGAQPANPPAAPAH